MREVASIIKGEVNMCKPQKIKETMTLLGIASILTCRRVEWQELSGQR